MKRIIRWICLVPAVIAVWILTGILAAGVFLLMRRAGIEAEGKPPLFGYLAWASYLIAALGGYAMVVAANAIAPSGKPIAALAVAIISALFFVLDHFWFQGGGGALALAAGAVAGALHILMNNRRRNNGRAVSS